ncbi:MAG: DUF4105 domain-containing protein [Proteobacteria bacterium]|nr:DUF4105 domain-containing protein [Pseudomonadota bacterium]
MFKWFNAHPLRPAIAAIALILLLGATEFADHPARLQRNWYPYLSHTTRIDRQGDRFTAAPVTDWSYAASGPTSQTYVSVSYNISDVRAVWFVIEPDPNLSFAAHTFMLFEFPDDRLLGLTIEARREANEDYSALAGTFNQFELSYLWGTARDLLTRRAVMLQHRVMIYPVNIPHDQMQAMLRNVLTRTQSLEYTPRYYNTLFSNCTNELAKAAGFHWAPAFILTGESDEYLFNRHLLDAPSLAAARQRAEMEGVIAQLNSAPAAAFDYRLLAELRRRAAGVSDSGGPQASR